MHAQHAELQQWSALQQVLAGPDCIMCNRKHAQGMCQASSVGPGYVACLTAGWINQSVKVFVVSTFGQEAWEKIVAIDPDTFGKQWVSSCPFPDSETYK